TVRAGVADAHRPTAPAGLRPRPHRRRPLKEITMNSSLSASASSLRRSLRMPVAVGATVCLAFFGGFAAWSALVPLASAAIGPGVVSPDGSRRVVQHLEG